MHPHLAEPSGVDAFWNAIGDTRSRTAAMDADIEALLEAAFVTHSDIDGPRWRLAAYLGERLRAADDLPTTLRRVFVADLLMVCAALDGDPAAQAKLEGELAPILHKAAARFAASDDERRECVQGLRVHLLVAEPGAAPRLASYRGSAPLRGWIRASAMRWLVDRQRQLRRQPRTVAGEELLVHLPAAGDDPELQALRRRYAGPFRDALADAILALRSGQRVLLRGYYVHGLTIDELGAAHGVHRSTVARRLASARGALLEGLRAGLAARIHCPEHVSSIARLIDGHVDLSLSRLLASDG